MTHVQLVELSGNPGALKRPDGAHLVHSRLSRPVAFQSPAAYSMKVVLKGSETYDFGRQRMMLRPGLVMLTPPSIRAEVSFGGETEGGCFYVPKRAVAALHAEAASTDIEGGSASSAPDMPAVVLGDDGGRIARRLSAIMDDGGDLGDDLLTDILARLDFARGALQRLPERKASTRAALLQRAEVARGFLEDNFFRSVELQEIADAAGLSAFHLLRSFRRIYGEPPLRWHQNRRLDWAAERMARGETPSSLSDRLGFSSPGVFCKAFKRRHGVPPTGLLAN